MLKKFLETIEKYKLVEKNDLIILGLSGGADSVCLLDLFLKIREEYCLNITAVHIHHGLRGILADNDLNFCKIKCEELDVSFEAYHFNIKEIAAERGVSIEEAGREKRYEVFGDVAKKRHADKIAVAHNMNDQAETLLMRFFRGTGLKGLGGMRTLVDNIIRPLLFVTREEIEKYCLENNLSYVVDLSNFDTDYTRCNIRRTIIPKITKEFNENIVKTLSRTAHILSEENEFLEKLTESYYQCCVSDSGININELRKIDTVIKRRVIRQAISAVSLRDVSHEHIEMALELINKPTGKMINLPGGISLQRSYEHLTITTTLPPPDYSYELCHEGEILAQDIGICLSIKINHDKFYEFSCKTEYTISLDYDKIVQTVQMRNRRPGDVIHINGMTKKLKKYFIDEKIPRAERNTIPIIADGKNIICIMPDKKSDIYKVTDETQKIMHIAVLNF